MDATARHIETKGCATVSVEPVGACGRLSVVPQPIEATLSVRRIGDGRLNTRHEGLNPRITCSLVCEVTTSKYLRVTPVEPMWVDVGLDIDYSVLSNTDWMLN